MRSQSDDQISVLCSMQVLVVVVVVVVVFIIFVLTQNCVYRTLKNGGNGERKKC